MERPTTGEPLRREGPPTPPRPSASLIAVRDGAGGLELLLVRRNPAQRFMGGFWVFPGGAVDAGESHRAAAVRELAEEAGVAASTWHVLVDAVTSPGMSDEAIRIYLARGLSEVDRDVQEHEEADMTSSWVPLDEAARRVLAGEMENAMACLGVLAAERAARDGFAGLRPADAPWPSGKARP